MTRQGLGVGLTAASCVALIVLTWLPMLGLPLTGADCWPILVQAARPPSLVLGQVYLEGLWEGADFFRPLLTLVAGVEWRLFGATPWGWHSLRLLALLLTALGCGALAMRAGGSRSAALASGSLLFALHPLQWQTVPAVARDADTFAALLGVAGLLALLPETGLGRGRRIAGVILLLAAPLVKETGLVMPLVGVVVLMVSAWRGRGSTSADGRREGSLALALMGGLLVEMAWRWWLLGSLGGYRSVVHPAGLGVRLGRMLRGGLGPEGAWQALLVAAILVGTLLATRRLLSGAPPSSQWSVLRIGCWSWLTIALAGALTSPRAGTRHAEALLAPAAILVAGAIGRVWDRRRQRPALWASTLTGVLVGAAILLGPGIVERLSCRAWRQAGELGERVLAASASAARGALEARAPVERRLADRRILARPLGRGGGVEVKITPFPYRPPGASTTVMALMPYSVRAYLLAQGIAEPIRVLPGRGRRGAPHSERDAGGRKTGDE